MHRMPVGSTPADCRPGCQCKKGYMLDTVAKKCIKPEECPCHHGGRSYPDGETMQEDCNTWWEYSYTRCPETSEFISNREP